MEYSYFRDPYSDELMTQLNTPYFLLLRARSLALLKL